MKNREHFRSELKSYKITIIIFINSLWRPAATQHSRYSCVFPARKIRFHRFIFDVIYRLAVFSVKCLFSIQSIYDLSTIFVPLTFGDRITRTLNHIGIHCMQSEQGIERRQTTGRGITKEENRETKTKEVSETRGR